MSIISRTYTQLPKHAILLLQDKILLSILLLQDIILLSSFLSLATPYAYSTSQSVGLVIDRGSSLELSH